MHDRRCSASPLVRAGLWVLSATLITASSSAALNRPWDPIVLTGDQLPGLIGAQPSRLVAYRYESGWIQIPVQVDERAVVDFGTIYHTTPSGYTVLTYTDAGTFTGADPDPTFDGDDEIVFMTAQAGAAEASAPEPAGAIPGSGIQLTLTDSLYGGSGYIYLFRSDGSLDPGAGAHPVAYDFVLLSGDYRTTYNIQQGPNPENSIVSTDAYALHFADRWIRDETRITVGGATGVDILDRHKNLFAPSTCTRSEDTFSLGEGAFIVNRVGPVRALRGYVGANSGPTTYRIQAFYAGREDVSTVLRVHPIPGLMDFFDYSPAAVGMVFRDDLNPGGVVIDGINDTVAPGQFSWEMVSGAQGTLAMAVWVETNIPGFDYTSYYLDDSTPPVTQCTGDAFAYGSSGLWEDDPIPNTDPAVNPTYYRFMERRVICYGAPNQPAAFAQARSDEIRLPVSVAASPYAPSPSAVGDRNLPVGTLLVATRPNPAGRMVELLLILSNPGIVTARIYDPSGRLVLSEVSPSLRRGENTLRIETGALPRGCYALVVTGPDGSQASCRAVLGL